MSGSEDTSEVGNSRQQLTVAALDAMQDLFYAFDTEANITEYNQRLLSVTGYTAAEVASMEPWDFFPDDYQAEVAEKVTQTLENQQAVSLEAELLTSTGEQIPYEFTAAPYYTDSDELAGFVGIGRDISARRERERQYKRTKEFLQQTQEVANLGCWEVDFSTDSVRWTDQTFRIHDLPLDAEPSLEEAFEFYHPDDRDEVVSAFDRLRNHQEPFDLELRIVSAADEVKWVRVRGEPWQNDDEVVGARGTFQDITEQVMDRLQLQQQRDDLKTLNEMLSHDIRNNLQVVTARAGIIADQVEENAQTHAETILRNAESAVDLIESARSLATAMLNQDQGHHPIDLPDVLNAVIDEIQTTSPAASVTVNGTIPNISVRADNMLPSVFRNLLINGIQHSNTENPTVRVSATVRGDEVNIRITDNGPGIPQEQREAIFEKSAKGPDSGGTGIGLYLVQTLVDNYGGDLWVEDGDAGGSVFVVVLPVMNT